MLKISDIPLIIHAFIKSICPSMCCALIYSLFFSVSLLDWSLLQCNRYVQQTLKNKQSFHSSTTQMNPHDKKEHAKVSNPQNNHYATGHLENSGQGCLCSSSGQGQEQWFPTWALSITSQLRSRENTSSHEPLVN